MALNAKIHREDLFQGAEFLAEQLTAYAKICAQYLRKSTSGRGNLMSGIVDSYVSLLQYAAELKKLGTQGFLCTFLTLDYPVLFSRFSAYSLQQV
jgi:hypothetical protein